MYAVTLELLAAMTNVDAIVSNNNTTIDFAIVFIIIPHTFVSEYNAFFRMHQF